MSAQQAKNDTNQGKSGNNSMQAQSAKNSAEEQQGSSLSESFNGSQLDQFVAYLKENWKPILTELVAAGVTAYLTHDAKTKMSKRTQN